MALARVKTWNPGDTLTAADLNAEFNNILNNPTALVNLTAAGDVCIVSSAAAVTRLAIGTANQFLTVSTGLLPAWSAPFFSQSRVSNLVGVTTTGQTATYSADQYVLRSTAAVPTFVSLFSTSSFTVNVGTSGPAANGRDQAGVFASTFVHIYAISTGLNSTTPAGIASTVPPMTGPTFPTSYSHWAYLATHPYSSASTTFSAIQHVRGAAIMYADRTAFTLLSGGAATSETSVTVSSAVPLNALLYTVEYFNGAAVTARVRSVTGIDRAVSAVTGTRYTINLVNTTSQGFLYTNDSSGGALSIQLLDYRVANGGE